MEKYYLANIALLTENVVAKTANLVKATAGLGSSGETLGFSGDIQLDIDASITKNKEESTTQKGSTLFAGGNLSIQSGKTAKIEGSELGAEGELSIDAEDVEITAARNTNKSSSSTKQAHINGSYSTNGSWGVNADASYSEMDSESTTWANSRLNATNIAIRSKNDTTVRGGVVTANERLDLNVGGNLVVESLQDKSSSGSHSLGLSAGYSESKDSDGKTTSSGNFGGNFSVSSSTKKWVTEQTSLTGNSVNIYVENKTTLKGAVIAATSNDLTLDTGSFEYIHIKDKDISYNAGAGVNLGSNSTGKPEEKNNTWSVNASYGFSQKRQTNFATIGEGTIIVRDGDTDLSGLNRDTSISQYGTVDIGLKGGFTVDSSTVALVTSPVKTIKEMHEALEKGYNDAKKTSTDIYAQSIVVYEKVGEIIGSNLLHDDARIRIQAAIKSGDYIKYGSLDYFNSKMDLGYYAEGGEGIHFVRDDQGGVTALVERSADGTGYGVYKYGSGSELYSTLDYTVNNPDFNLAGGLTKDDYRNNTDYVFGILRDVSDSAGIIKSDELFGFIVEGARSYFSKLTFSDQGQLNYTYAGIMDNLGNQFDGSISYSTKAVVIQGTMTPTSSIDCSSYVAAGIHILGLNESGKTGTAINPQYYNPSDFRYTPTEQWGTSHANGPAVLTHNESVVTKYDASTMNGVDKTGMIGVTVVNRGKIFSDLKLDHVYVSLDKDSNEITESHGLNNYGVNAKHDNAYNSGNRTKYYLQLNLPKEREQKNEK